MIMAEPTLMQEISDNLADGRVVVYLGPGMLELVPGTCPVPASPEALAEQLVAKVSVPHKIRKNLTAAAQFIENFKHRKTLTTLMKDAFAASVEPGPLHRYLAGLAKKPVLIVSAWYDNTMENALRAEEKAAGNQRSSDAVACPSGEWGQIQGVSQAEHGGNWVHYFHSSGEAAEESEAESWSTILYQPIGSVTPAANFIVSDSDYVEVLTEIDIQTPIPPLVQQMRTGCGFLFLGCRFRSQLERAFARQIMKRSGGRHWAVLPGELTRNELRFLEEQNIQRLDMPLADFADQMTGAPEREAVAVAVAG
jgi:hypothetical protein